MNKITRLKIIVFLLCSVFIKSQAQLVVNEIFLSNGSKQLGPDYNYSNWVELYNPSANTVSTVGLYLSNDSANLKKWPLPVSNIEAGVYRAYYLTGQNMGLYASFKADADKGSLFLSNESGEVLERFDYPKQYYNFSFGRFPDASDTISYFNNPTFEASNNSDTISERSSSLSFSQQGGFYESAFTLSLINTLNQGQIYYTLDGTEPDTGSTVYTSPIEISQTTVVRARIIESGKMYGSIKSNTYLIGQRKPKLPVMALITDPKNLFNDTIGIYVIGTNGRPNGCMEEPANYNQDWERSANFEYIDTVEGQVVNQMLGIKIAGGCSRNIIQKSFSFTARSKYGKDRIDHKFFKEREFSRFNSIMARTGANDWSYTLCRDAIIQKLSDRFMDLEHQAIQPAVIFINGEYYGLQHVYERSGEDLIEAKYGYKQDEIDLGERQGISLEGSAEDYTALLEYLNTHSMADNESYQYVSSQIDIDNFIDYNIFEIYIGNYDWPASNSKYWRKKGGKWRWILFDTDFGFGLYEHHANHETLKMMLEAPSDPYAWPNPEWSTRLFRKLLENPGFKRKFVNRFYGHINTTFKPEYVFHTIDSFKSIIEDEVSFHFARWNRNGSQWGNYIQELKDFSVNRPEVVRSHLRDLLGTGQNITLSCTSEAPGYGYISIDSLIADKPDFSGIYAAGSVVEINFIPAPGYTFLKAVRTSAGATKEISTRLYTDTLNADVSFVLYFEKVLPLANIIINEIAASNREFADEFQENDDWIEIYNKGTDTVEISGLYISDSLQMPLKYRIPYVNGLPVTIAPQEYKILWADNQTIQGPLHLNFKLKSAGETIALSQKTGEETVTLDQCQYINLTATKQSFGRIPDITGEFKKLDVPSPLRANVDNLPVTIASESKEISIWYSPSDKRVNIVLNENIDQSSYLLTDLSGRKIMRGFLYHSQESIGLQGLKSGVYLITVTSKGKNTTRKLFVE